MIFGRKKASGPVVDEVEVDETDVLEDDLDLEDDDEVTDEWSTLDRMDWREDGPFDITEVDLDADDVVRLDLGTIIVTPFEGMQVQLQVDEASREVRAMLVLHEGSGIEVALFAAPKATSMLAEVRADMIADTASGGGTVEVVKGPFGAEIRRRLPITGPEGEKLLHVSRTWFAQGPRWLLRGVVMGAAGEETGTERATLALYEFFANVVVRRGEAPLAAGDVIPMSLPEGAQQ